MEKAYRVGRLKPLVTLWFLPVALTFVFCSLAEAGPQYNMTCSSCHGMSPIDSPDRNPMTGGFSGNHQTHEPAGSATVSDCARCHVVNGFTTSHMDGGIGFRASINNSPATGQYKIGSGAVSFKNQTSVPTLGTCSNVNCHFERVTPVWGRTPYDTTADCSGCHTIPGSSLGHGKHNLYYPALGGCAKCHPDHSALQFSHATSAGSRGIKVTSEGNYSGSGLNFLPSQSASRVFGSCTNLYCHSPGDKGAAPYNAPVQTATWGNGSLNCTGCHKSDAASGNPMNSPAGGYGHARHLSSTISNDIACATCHAATVSNNTSIKSRPDHVDRFVTIRFKNSTTAVGGTYNGAAASGTTYKKAAGTAPGACLNVYCHSDGQAPPTYRSVVWGSGPMPADCTGCHGGALTGTLSGKHDQHVNNGSYLGSNFKCGDCHAKTVGAASDTVVTVRTKHINRFADYSGAKAGRNGKDCSNVYCHSDGKGTAANPGSWISGAAINDCKGCHGAKTVAQGADFDSVAGEPNYVTGNAGTPTANSHRKHVGSAGASSCDACHTLTTTTGIGIASGSTRHIDGTIDVSFNPAKTGGTAEWAAGKTCNNISCHAGRSAQWGQPGNCDLCHPASSLKGAHNKHLSGAMPRFYTYTGNHSYGSDATGKYQFGCSNCHPLVNANHARGQVLLDFRPTVPGQSVSLLRSKNRSTITTFGVAGVAGGTDPTSVPGSRVVCLNVYCHSNGYAGTPVYAVTPEWYEGSFTGDRCSNCHGNSPNGTIAGSAAHSAHVVGIHAGDIFSGGIGKLSAGSGGNVSHGVAAQATTINCNTCHNATVTYSRNDRNTACNSCHSAGSDFAQIANRGTHVNGRVDIAFPGTTVVSKAQLRPASFASYTAAGGYWTRNGGNYKAGATSFDTSKLALSNPMWNAGSCSNIACHMGKQVNWNDTAVDCESCHSSL
ncbi:CxxxxCH/CxxCH domain-containing protein [Geobacter sp. DSM 9736]|uniref:CxxxxCH/CxxCH domain c-type cytochrome n=1 Tax=Geobacter sp. DSM 9736 TaxID=1277350 RepID=UPI000B5032A4|nr:CxxxxCH/CxxCH domain-containing protein [Geobacter sp. DSM 9736]SNB45996.1 Geobacter sulfurreducens CxxxxCH...CXXCH domain-containing protein [Geobacter sp. DSM 9736]